MALTEIPSELSSTPSIVDNGNATAITIGSDESVALGGALTVDTNTLVVDATNNRVGIGTSSPVRPLSVKASQEQLTLSEGDARGATFDYSSATGNLNIATNGINARTNPQFTLDLNGRVDIGGVGNISPYGIRFAINGTGTGGAGLYFGSGVIIPTDNTPTISDATVDLGASNYRFKDIYLSGGVNFSANANAGGMQSETLADYEEGTWTPVPVGLGDSGGTYSGFYTKTGRIVNWSCYIVLPSTADTSFGEFGGLPFASTAGQGTTGNSGVSYKNSTTDLQILINQSTATMYWYNSAGAQQTYANFSGISLYMGGSYITDL